MIRVCFLICRIIYRIFLVFPIKKNKVFFSSFSGKCYCDNPRAISEKLHEIAPDYLIVWQRRKGSSFKVPPYVKLTTWPSIGWFYHMATSRVWVDSHLKLPFIRKRTNQFFIETWHGGLGFKKIEYDSEAHSLSYFEKKRLEHTTRIADVFISNSEYLNQVYRTAFAYNGQIEKLGFPKSDRLLNSSGKNENEEIKRLYGIPHNKHIVLYAPTFRNHSDLSVFILDFELFCKSYKKRFGLDCVVLIHLHPSIPRKVYSLYRFGGSLINATDYSDVQKLVLACDSCVTDYSSIAFDFMICKKPVFLYTPDLDYYENGLYEAIEQYPFLSGKSMKALCRRMERFDEEVYNNKLHNYVRKTGLFEDGQASLRVVQLLLARL